MEKESFKKDDFTSFFAKQGKQIKFVVYGKESLYFMKSKDTSMVDTRVMLLSGINHFLYYVHKFQPERVKEVVSFFTNTYFHIMSKESAMERSVDYNKELRDLIDEVCSLNNPSIIRLICDYVHHITIRDINEMNATTKTATITNYMAEALHVMTVCVKITFVFGALLRNDITYNETLNSFIDRLSKNVYDTFVEYADEKGWYPDYYSHNGLDLFSSIDELVFALVENQWSSLVKTKSFRDKFSAVGDDNITMTKKNKVDIYSSFKKYIPRLANATLYDKYHMNNEALMEESDSKHLPEKYWVEGDDFEDFVFNNKNIAGYIQKTLRKIIGGQDTKRPFKQKINVPDLLASFNEETITNTESSLYQDKFGHLMNIRKSAALDMFKKIIHELEAYDTDDMENFLKEFNINKNHYFNQYILSKIYLSLTGENRVFKELFGRFNKITLGLFYLRVFESEELSFMRDKIELMRTPSKPTADLYQESAVAEFLKSKDDNTNPTIFGKCLGIYRGETDNYILQIEDFYKLFIKLKPAWFVNDLLFPNQTNGIVRGKEHRLEDYTNLNRKTLMAYKDIVLKGVYDD